MKDHIHHHMKLCFNLQSIVCVDLTIMSIEPVYYTWPDVYFMMMSEGFYVKGTMFLTESIPIQIHWVPDADQDSLFSSSKPTSMNIDVDTIYTIHCRKITKVSYPTISFVLKSKDFHGPFEFRNGGLKDFKNCLRKFVNFYESPEDESTLIVEDCNYQLPYTIGQHVNMRNIGVETITQQIGVTFRRIGQVVDMFDMLNPIRSGNNNNNNNQQMEESMIKDLQQLRTGSDDSDFAIVMKKPVPIKLPKLIEVQRSKNILTVGSWKNYLDYEGRVTCLDKLKKVIFEGGIEPALRPVLWKYLLGYYHWEYTAEENEKLRIEKHQEYHRMKSFWKPMSNERLARFDLFCERRNYISKDVPRTDRRLPFFEDDSQSSLSHLTDILTTYSLYNMNLGYSQGMNDLLALILYVIKEEEDSFWCFVGLMNRLESNFGSNSSAIMAQFKQLFSLIEVLDPIFGDFLESKKVKDTPLCFRWLLIHFKREFSYEDIMTLWEVIWTDYLTNNFHLFFAAAILLTERDIIMESDYDANGILKHINDLANKIPIDETLCKATSYIYQLDQVLNSLDSCTRDIISGLSLSSYKPEKFDYSDDRFNNHCDYSIISPNEDTSSVHTDAKTESDFIDNHKEMNSVIEKSNFLFQFNPD